MKDPKAIRKAIMTARNIAAMVDPNFARVPLPQVGEPDYEEMRPPLQFSMGGRLPAQRSDNPFEQFQSQDPFSFDLPDHTYAAGGEVYGDNSKIKVVGNYEGEHRLVPISPKNTNYQHVMEYVPIDWLMEHRGNEYRHSPERMEQLRNEIQEEGLREPVLISTGKNSRTSIVGEGNHRVLAAKQLGYTHIPVRAMVGSSAGSDRFPEGAHDEDIIPEPNRYFPSDAKPSRVMRSLGYEGQPELPEDWWEKGYAYGGEVEQVTDYSTPDDMGLYSHAAVTAANAPQAKASPEEFRNILTNRGVKQSEFDASGYDQAFAGQPQVTREQVAEHFHKNRTPIEEKGFYADNPNVGKLKALEDEYWGKYGELMDRKRAFHEANPDVDLSKIQWGREEGDALRADLRKKREALILSKDYTESAGDPHHEDYALPGGENYREILLKHGDEGKFGGVPGHFGDEPDILTSLRMKDRTDSDGNKVLHLDELQSDWGQQAKKSGIYSPKEHQEYLRDLEQRAALFVAEEFGIPEETARAKMPEWTRTGFLRHHRLAEMLGEGDEFHDRSMEDISRRNESVAEAPYVGKTEQWLNLGLKRALLEAARGDHDRLAWTPGDMQADRYPGGSDEEEAKRRAGMVHFYDKMLPKALLKLAKQHDPEARFSTSTVKHPEEYSENGRSDYISDTTSNLPALEMTPKMRESILRHGFAAHADGGRVEGYAGGGDVEAYQDPETQYISDWNWRPVEDVQESLGGLREIPSHVEKFGDFMDNIAQRAAGSGLTPRDLIKAYTITRSSIQRQAADVNKLRASGLDLPEEMTGKIRPEGAFGEWLHTPAGQAYLDAAERGKVHQTAIQDAIKVMAPFGRHQTDIPDALTWAALNLPGKEKQVSELVHAGHLMASTPEEWRAFTQHIRGVGPSKSGFLASLMGRGDQPTLDARQIILHTGRPTKEASKYIAKKGGAGGIEAVDRLAARQSAMDLSLPDRLKPYYQHLAHHAVWDKAGNDETTHEDVVRAMHHAANGGAQVDDEGEGILSHPVAKIFQTIGMAGLNDPSVDPEKFKEYLQRAQNALARKITTKGSDVLASYPGAADVKMSKFGKPLEEMESTAIQKGFMLPRKEADIEEMQRRKARIFPFLGDLSPADKILLKSGQTSLINPSEQQGGSDFMRSEFAKGSDPAAYGNRIGAAKTLAKKIASQTPEGTPAIGTHVAMGLGSVDSSHHAYEPILRMIPNSPIAQKHIDEFDAMMHEALPPTKKYPMAWPGIMNTEEAEQFFAGRPGTHASFFAKKIDSSKWQKAGFPDIGEVRFSASTPELLGAPRLSTGHAFSQVEPSGRVITKPDLKHKTYPALIPSEGEGYLGGSSTPIPAKLMFSDFYKTMKTKDKSGKEIDYDSPAGQTLFQQSLMTKVPYQDATQEWLDNIMEDRRQKQERGFKKGGKVRGALMIAKGLKKR